MCAMVALAMGRKIGRLSGLVFVLTLVQSLQAADDIYNKGPLDVALLKAQGPLFPNSPSCQKTSTRPTASGQPPPRELFIAVPKTSGQYPVIQLQHAFTMETSFYGQLLQHVASHGFIIVAPQVSCISFKILSMPGIVLMQRKVKSVGPTSSAAFQYNKSKNSL